MTLTADHRLVDGEPPGSSTRSAGGSRTTGSCGATPRWASVMATLPMPRAMPPLANLRDVGGHAVRGGGRVRRGVLYRSTDLSALDDPGLEVLAGLGVRTVYDLRTRIERETHPDRLPDGARLLVADVLEGAPPEGSPFHLMSVMQDAGAIHAVLADGGAERFFVDRYRALVELDSAREGFGRMFRDIALSGTRPGLVHCTSGKDRTAGPWPRCCSCSASPRTRC